MFWQSVWNSFPDRPLVRANKPHACNANRNKVAVRDQNPMDILDKIVFPKPESNAYENHENSLQEEAEDYNSFCVAFVFWQGDSQVVAEA